MNSTLPSPIFTCPICHSSLMIEQKSWRCDGKKNYDNIKNGKGSQHSFDVARQGYINLLPVQQKKSKNPGDSQESVQARTQFLQGGFYQPLQNLLARMVKDQLITQNLANDSELANNSEVATIHNWLDIGCGEGYYSQAIANVDNTAQSINPLIDQFIAIDISKSAIIELAKTNKQQQVLWSQANNQNQITPQRTTMYPVVASASNLPLADDSVQGISSIFSPILPEEMARVLIKGGMLIVAKPDIGHLASIRQGLFDEVREHNSDKFIEQLTAVGFELVSCERVQNIFNLDKPQLSQLLTMTPYSYRAKRENRENLLEKAEKIGLVTQAKFIVYVFLLQ